MIDAPATVKFKKLHASGKKVIVLRTGGKNVAFRPITHLQLQMWDHYIIDDRCRVRYDPDSRQGGTALKDWSMHHFTTKSTKPPKSQVPVSIRIVYQPPVEKVTVKNVQHIRRRGLCSQCGNKGHLRTLTLYSDNSLKTACLFCLA